MLKPLHDRVIVLPDKEERTKGGILLPETARERPLHGKVMAVGPGKRLENGSLAPMEVKPDDRVLYAKYSGTEIKVRGEEYMILRQDDILGIVD
ncbi:MAG: co-chaperone GroES [Fimbriimonadia bacterium]|jgi:chaperonin GroES